MTKDNPKLQFLSLDSLRGVAAVWVCVYHMSWYFPGQPANLIHNGYLFVDFFFVLSGFVIYHAYSSRISSGADFKQFIVMRLGRIYPIHLLFLLIFLGAEIAKYLSQSGDIHTNAAFSRNTLGAFVSNIFLTQALNLHPGLTFNPPAWSISVEFWTYICFALVLLFAKRFFVPISVAVIGTSIAILAMTYGHLNSCYDYAIFRCLSGFFIGCFCYMAFKAINAGEYAKSRLSGNTPEFMIVACLLLLLILKPREVISDFIMLPVTALLILVFAFEAGILSRLLKHPILLFLGKISYSIYMSHLLIILCMRTFLRHILKYPLDSQGTILTPWPLGLLCVVLTTGIIVGFSYLTYRFIEDPARNYVRNRFSSKPKKAVATA